MFGILAVFSKLNEFQYALKARPPCDSDDVWAGMLRSLDSVTFLRTPSHPRTQNQHTLTARFWRLFQDLHKKEFQAWAYLAN
jgi:hypothetical protein